MVIQVKNMNTQCKKFICILCILLIPNNILAKEVCKAEGVLKNKNYLVATYEIEVEMKNKKLSKSLMVFSRRNGQVSYTKNGITEIWDHLNNGRMKLTRYYDQYEKGIEYQANEIFLHKKLDGWESKHQIISNERLKSMRQEIKEVRNCISYQTLVENGSVGDAIDKLNIIWMPDYQLPQVIKNTTPLGSVVWKLVDLSFDTFKVDKIYTDRNIYQLTDYADIGDNESDPFLRKMINLGFIKHADKVFYASEQGIQPHQIKQPTSHLH